MNIIVGSKNLTVDVSCIADVSGRDHLVVISKSTWQIPSPGERPRPIAPLPLENADLYAGAPGESAMLYGSDIVRFKPRCDVLFNAKAHAPNQVQVSELSVAWQVGIIRKGLKVHGPRQWRKRLGMYSISPAEPFFEMPLHFGFAFGGTRIYKKGWGGNGKILAEANLFNPSGIGWFGSSANEEIDGQAAPQLEALDDPIRKPNGKNVPTAFSAIARHWHPRPSFGGTYDEHWQKEIFPFLPDDFDDQFNQCAPVDQQMPYPKGGEQVILRNMVKGRQDVRFKLPGLNSLKVRILRDDFTTEEPIVVADTLYFEPEEGRFSVVWRASVKVRRKLQEFDTIAVGPVSAQWWRDKSLGLTGNCFGCTNSKNELTDAGMIV